LIAATCSRKEFAAASSERGFSDSVPPADRQTERAFSSVRFNVSHCVNCQFPLTFLLDIDIRKSSRTGSDYPLVLKPRCADSCHDNRIFIDVQANVIMLDLENFVLSGSEVGEKLALIEKFTTCICVNELVRIKMLKHLYVVCCKGLLQFVFHPEDLFSHFLGGIWGFFGGTLRLDGCSYSYCQNAKQQNSWSHGFSIL